MKQLIICLIISFSFLFSHAKPYITCLKQDTIDFNMRRFFFSIPEESIIYSIRACDGHGCLYYFPLSDSGDGIIFANLIMTEFDVEEKMASDIELWNYYDGVDRKSRGYLRNGLYYRLDKYEDGTIIYYSHLSEKLACLANRVMDSVIMKRKDDSDLELNSNKRRNGKII